MISFSLPRKHVPDISLLVQVQNHPHNYLVDCGALHTFSVRQLQRVRAVFVSHTHVDHWIEFDTLLRHQIQDNIELVVCGPAGITDRVRAKLQAYNWNLLNERSARYRVREIIDGNHIVEHRLHPPHYLPERRPGYDEVLFENGALRVECTLLDHRIPSVAYCFVTPERVQLQLDGSGYRGGPWAAALKAAFEADTPDTPIEIDGTTHRAAALFHLLQRHPGIRVGVVLDHAISDSNRAAIRTLLRGADRVYIESYFLERDRALALKKAHSCSVASARTLSGLAIREVYPIHHSRKYSEEEIEQLRAEFYAAYDPDEG